MISVIDHNNKQFVAGTHCLNLQYLDISNSKQVSDTGIDYLVCQVQIRDKMDVLSQISCESSALHKVNQNRLTTFEQGTALRSQQRYLKYLTS